MVEGVLHGYNATVFAYGATGAGKTYTMIGTAENPGNMFMTLKHLFMQMNEMKWENMYNVWVSFLEIYNENIKDLIVTSTDWLDMWEDPEKGITVAGLSEIEVDSPEDVM